MKGSSKTRYLKRIVAYCIALLTIVIVAVYIAAWFDVDTGNLLTATCGVFGGELLLTVVIKIMGGKAETASKPTATIAQSKATTDKASTQKPTTQEKSWG